MLYLVVYSIASRGGHPMGGGSRRVEANSSRQAEIYATCDLRREFDAPRARVSFSYIGPPAPQCPVCGHWHFPGEGCAGCGCRY
jgi:hypothetical protein